MKTVIVTGGTGALGTPVSLRLIGEGYHVLVPYLRDARADLLRAAVPPEHRERLELVRSDMLDAESVERMFVPFRNDHGLHAFVHLVGGIRSFTTIAGTGIADWDALMGLNLRSLFLVARSAMGIFERQGSGRIVTIGAMAGIKPSAKHTAYGVAKAGVIALTRILADEGRAHGVTANCIAPSIIRTAANLAWGSESDSRGWVTPEEIAATVSFLLSNAAAGVNGTVIQAFGALNI